MRRSEATESDRQHVREYVGRARFFIDNVNRRRATLHRIAECLVDRQRDYLQHGVQHLVPLTRAEVGALIGMHESTVSRATAEKFVMLPTGEVVPFGHFFTASLGVKDQIRKMIEGEEPGRPLSDQEIADRLGDEGVAIARRTVAKYRDELSSFRPAFAGAKPRCLAARSSGAWSRLPSAWSCSAASCSWPPPSTAEPPRSTASA